ncbi:acetyltransferase EpsM [Evansella vedderi]|uniref:Acetyltransferase EpsM n=2 Tax=Evansella vedderi TaxID=38282 RepID=A0ABT9ZVS3_9BACI|nr:acetyltransferase EpsM [Evansella vedderi]
MMKNLVIIGMGGHSKVVTDVAKRQGYSIIGYVDDKPRPYEKGYLCTLNEFLDEKSFHDYDVFIAVGNNRDRQQIVNDLTPFSLSYATLIDPSAVIGSKVRVNKGTLVMPGTVINANVQIGRHVIINTGSTVDHDCSVEDFVHLSPGVNLAGGVTVKKGAQLGIGSVVIPLKTINEYSVIGAGAVVIDNIPADSTAVGIPATVIRNN